MVEESKKRIVFFCASSPSVMLYKIGRVLKQNRYDLILFAMCEKDRFDMDFYREAFDKIVCSDFQLKRNPHSSAVDG